jgi:hypothetical protein
MFPANFRFVLLLHSVDRYTSTNVSLHSLIIIQCRSQLFTAYLIPPQSHTSVTKKGQAQQQTGRRATLAHSDTIICLFTCIIISMSTTKIGTKSYAPSLTNFFVNIPLVYCAYLWDSILLYEWQPFPKLGRECRIIKRCQILRKLLYIWHIFWRAL